MLRIASERRSQRRPTSSSSTSVPEAKLANASDAHIPAVSVQRQAARALIASADLADARAAALALAAKQRGEWIGTEAHARALSRLQMAVELATQLQIKWETQRIVVKRSLRKKVDARIGQLGGVKEPKGRLALASATRVDRQALHVAEMLEDAVMMAADALKHSRRSSAVKRLAEKKERRRDGGSEDAAEARIPSTPQTVKLPPLVQMEMPHQHIPSVLWRMYEGVMANPRASYRLRRAMQDVAETIRELNPYFFLKTLYRPPPASEAGGEGGSKWEVRRTNAVNAIILSLMPLFHDLSHRAFWLSSPDADARKKAWFDASATLHLVRRLALHFHFVMLHLYAVTMGRHDRTATPWTFEQLVYAANCDELAFRRSLGLVEESACSKDFLITDTFEHAPELLVFMDAWRDETNLAGIGEPVTDAFGFTAREHFQSFVPVFEDDTTRLSASSSVYDAVRELGLELKHLCDDWVSSPLGSGAFRAIRIEALGVVEKTIKHRLRGVMEITHKITLARWMERRERMSRAKWWRQLNLRELKPVKKSKHKKLATAQKGGESSLLGLAAGRPDFGEEEDVQGAVVHDERQLTTDESSSLPSSAEGPASSATKDEKATGVLVSPLLSATPARSSLSTKCDVAPSAPNGTTPRVQTSDKDCSVSPSTVVDFRNRVKKIPDDLQQTAARDGFRAPVSVKYASWVASNVPDRSSKVRDGSANTSQSSEPVATRLLPEQAAGGVVLLKDVYTWTDDEIDAHEREMERVCAVRNELLGLRDALTVAKLEHEASERLGCRPAQRLRAASALPLRGLTLAAVSVEARALSETVAAFGEEVAMHGAAEALIKRPSLRVAASDSSEASIKAQPPMASLEVTEGSVDLRALTQALQAQLATPEGSDDDGDDEVVDADEDPVRSLAHIGVANLALLRMMNEHLVDAATCSAEGDA